MSCTDWLNTGNTFELTHTSNNVLVDVAHDIDVT